MEDVARCPLTIVVLALGAAVAGCSNVLLYNEARDKQGQALVKSVGEIDLVGSVEVLDMRFAALRELEADTLKARQATNRELEIALVASNGPDGAGTLADRYVKPLLDQRLERLVGKPLTVQDMDRVLAGLRTDERRDRLAASAMRTFGAMSGVELDSCATALRLADDRLALSPQALARVPAGRQPQAQSLFKNVLSQCEVREDPIRTLAHENGLLNAISKLRDTAAKQVDDRRKDLQKRRQQLVALQQQYDDDVKALDARSPDFRERLVEAAEKLKRAVEAWRKAAGTDPSVEQAESEARLKSLENVLGALASGDSDPAQLTPDERRSVAIVRLLPSVIDEADVLLKQAKRPRLGPLLLAKEQQRLAVESLAAQAALAERRAQLRSQQVDEARKEILALCRARRALGPPAQGAGVSVPITQTVDAAFEDTGEGGRRRAALYESLAYYFDHAQLHRLRQDLLDLAANGVTDEAVMSQSRAAARMWQSLAANMAAILADYHAAGIKPAELAEFLKGLGVFYVGHEAGK